jgi:predicted CopG family antitoxin
MKAVRISQEAYERLRAARRRGETTSQAAERLIYQEKSSG